MEEIYIIIKTMMNMKENGEMEKEKENVYINGPYMIKKKNYYFHICLKVILKMIILVL